MILRQNAVNSLTKLWKYIRGLYYPAWATFLGLVSRRHIVSLATNRKLGLRHCIFFSYLAGNLTLIRPHGDKKPQNLGPIIFGEFFFGGKFMARKSERRPWCKITPRPKNCNNENFFVAVKQLQSNENESIKCFFSEAIANMEALLDLKGEVVKMLRNWCKVLTSCQREFLSLSPSIFPFTLHPLSPSLLHPSSLTQSKLLCLHERDGWKKKSKVSLKKFGGKNWRETLKT